MNWIERLYELKGRDLYSQSGEGYYLEYILSHLDFDLNLIVDIGGGDGFYLSNSRHLSLQGWPVQIIDKENGDFITLENIELQNHSVLSIDIDGNDYWILNKVLNFHKPAIIVCEFNPAFTDARAIKYNPDHVWDGTDYYGFTFEAAKKLATEHGYMIIFNLANMNLFLLRNDLVQGLHVPEVTYRQDNFFPHNDKGEWVYL